MKALSIQQPWPWLILRPDLSKNERLAAMRDGLVKDIENRDWKYPPKPPAKLIIHASQKFDYDGWHWVRSRFPTIQLPGIGLDGEPVSNLKEQYRRGGIVGMCRAQDAVIESDSPWFVGKYGIPLRMPKPVVYIPYTGQLGFFDIDPGTVEKIKPL